MFQSNYSQESQTKDNEQTNLLGRRQSEFPNDWKWQDNARKIQNHVSSTVDGEHGVSVATGTFAGNVPTEAQWVAYHKDGHP